MREEGLGTRQRERSGRGRPGNEAIPCIEPFISPTILYIYSDRCSKPERLWTNKLKQNEMHDVLQIEYIFHPLQKVAMVMVLVPHSSSLNTVHE